MTPVSRRAFVGTAAGAAAALGTGLPGAAAAAPRSAPASDAAAVEAASAKAAKGPADTKTVKDVKHVVVLMQENRSFDHYLGTLSGVRGFDDKRVLMLPGEQSVLRQPAASRSDGGYLLPYRMDTTKYNAQNAGDLPHDWASTHQAWNGGAWNKWTAAKGGASMGYFTRQDISYQYALSDAFTVADHYFCSMSGPTDPNRLYLWTGTAGPGTDGTTGPFTDNSIVTENPIADWTTYAERLEQAGVSWRVYHNPSLDDRYGDYDDNALSYFKQFHAFPADDPRYINAMTKFDLTAFDADCRAGTLPTVSWLVAPYLFCEHPSASPDYGADYVNTALQSLMSNPDVWRDTVFLVMYDENDGYFDHVVPPFPPAGTEDEFVDGQPIGLGPRVPLWAVSPWSRGGYVNSQVFDHTSVLRFLEQVTGVEEPNISAWRRAVCGDLTSCFDFTERDMTIPRLPDTKALVLAADAGAKLPPVPQPALGAQATPSQEPGTRPRRPLPYQPGADVVVDRGTGRVTCTMTSTGQEAFHYNVYPHLALPFAATPFTVLPQTSQDYLWEAAQTDGGYDFSVHGADGFLRRFQGTVVRDGQDDQGVPSVRLRIQEGGKSKLRLTLGNDGGTEVRFTVTPNDFGGTPVTSYVAAGDKADVVWPTNDGRYDITVSANTSARFAYRYAGTVQ
ncbi:phosphocholine-specific phospholipase C [Streptacidiphilus sp. N1-3]|uniref:phospholipase C n=1 Tax=Streptacidiphilus alkalitolerans TaxID=3342712 RepID=A0ABV6X1G8_9ACTN